MNSLNEEDPTLPVDFNGRYDFEVQPLVLPKQCNVYV